MEEQRCPLVPGEPARETDGQRIRVEQRAHGDHLSRVHAVLRPSRSGALPCKGQKLSLEKETDVPQVFVGDIHHPIPKCDIVMPLDPLRAEVPIEEQAQFRCDPRRSVHTISNGSDRDLIFRNVRPGNLPHAPRHAAMEVANPIAPTRHP